MIRLYFQMATSSISRARWRSALTMLGVVIGIVSVVMIFALGDGLKKQVAGDLRELGSDLVIVRSGNLVERSSGDKITKINIRDAYTQSILTEKDLEAVKAMPEVSVAAPIAIVSGSIQSEDGKQPKASSSIIATTPQIRDILVRDVEQGEFFTSQELAKNLVVLGPGVSKDLFGDDSPVGRIIKIKNTDFVVRGVMAKAKTSPLDVVNVDYNNSVYIPIGAGKSLNGGVALIREIDVRLKDTVTPSAAAKSIYATVLASHGGVKEFTVLEARDFIGVLDKVFSVLTTFVAAVAGISLLVGGIGIMNIMLVSVSERTREIGIRKSIGATNHQILGQFLVEAVILTLIGGFIGVAISLLLSAAMRLYTDIHPFVEPAVVGFALMVTFIVGVVFGIVPALKAARKDPIESLR
jgi:putative ABC transport system permease protein